MFVSGCPPKEGFPTKPLLTPIAPASTVGSMGVCVLMFGRLGSYCQLSRPFDIPI